MKERKTEFQYTADNKIYKLFPILSVVWLIIGGYMITVMFKIPEEIPVWVKIMILFLYPVFEIVFLFSYKNFRDKNREFLNYKKQIIKSGKYTKGTIVQLRKHYINASENYKHPCYYAEIEYFNEIENKVVRRWTESLNNPPFGIKNYEKKGSNRDDELYHPLTTLTCEVYYTEYRNPFVL